jgi:intraflagellar transport protein 81
MSDITDIVNRLNAPPFSKRLRLVDFHDMPRSELLGVLGEVLCAIDPRQPRGEALREEKEDAMVARISGFLLMCKFPLPPVGTDSSDAFAAGLSEGDPAAIHPILQWLLQRVPQLQKRAYLARFLMPVEIPAEFTQDVALMELLGTYRELQSEFKRVHKAVESMRDNDLRPGELKSDMTQLEEERSQLKEKIARLKRNAANEPGFDEMLEVTTRLRAAQEEESRLAIKMHQQRAALLMTEQRLEQGSQKLQQLRASASGGASAEAVLLQLRSEVDALSIRAGRDLPREITNKLRVLRKLQRSQAEPPRTR